MKKTGLFILLLALISCGDIESDKVQSFDWMVGNWQRINEPDSISTFENWERNVEEEYLGKGISLKKGDTIFQENMRLLKNNNSWRLEVTGVNPEPTYFEMTELGKNNFTVENEENDFPKKITYWLHGDTLKAVIAGGENKVLFHFIKG